MKVLLVVAKYVKETVKVLYPIQDDKKALFENEIEILNKLNQKLQFNPVKNGVVKFIDSGKAKWKKDNDKERSPGRCFVVLYTYGKLLFPVIRRFVKTNDHKMIYCYFSQMVSVIKNFFNFEKM